MSGKEKSPLKVLLSLLILVFFIWGVGKSAFFPSLHLLQDTQWDTSLFLPVFGKKLLSFLLVVPAGLGFLGWARWFKNLLFSKIERSASRLLGLALALSFFSLYVFGLAINEILYWPLTALFFIPPIFTGWAECKSLSFPWREHGQNAWSLWVAIPLSLWFFEYLSPPLVWDAILDHFRYAREISRLHQILFHWTNHTGDMPKAAELVLAGFWNLGGESLSKLSSILPAILTFYLFFLFAREWKGDGKVSAWIFGTCPFFLAIYSWGYVEGFLAFFEVLAVFCFWKALQEPKNSVWLPLVAFFLGTAFVIKYTAILAIGSIVLVFVYEKFVSKNPSRLDFSFFLAFFLPIFPWLFKSCLAFGNPFYPLMTSVFGAGVGYSPEMEGGLLADTGLPLVAGILRFPLTLWNSFFTTSNAVNAAWTPLVAMCIPWAWNVFKRRLGVFLFVFSVLFFLGWFFVSSSLRHASGGAVVLLLLAALVWAEAFQEKKSGVKILFATGTVVSLWLCFSAQLTTTAPYASALGLEDPLLRLKRHYTYSTDTYAAYRFVENHSEPLDKVMAFAVFQTYSLQRTAFVDFKWKKPIFLDWASHCQTAEQLAKKLREEGIRYFLYQQWEAAAMSKLEKDFKLEGMPVSEYTRFWRFFVDPVKYENMSAGYHENSLVYLVRTTPRTDPIKMVITLPGLQEQDYGKEGWLKSNL